MVLVHAPFWLGVVFCPILCETWDGRAHDSPIWFGETGRGGNFCSEL
jgi:hypothetical protein